MIATKRQRLMTYTIMPYTCQRKSQVIFNAWVRKTICGEHLYWFVGTFDSEDAAKQACDKKKADLLPPLCDDLLHQIAEHQRQIAEHRAAVAKLNRRLRSFYQLVKHPARFSKKPKRQPTFYDGPGQNRTKCHNCRRYVGSRRAVCGCGQMLHANRAKRLKPPAPIYYDEPKRGRKQCPYCKRFVGIALRVCGCGQAFRENRSSLEAVLPEGTII